MAQFRGKVGIRRGYNQTKPGVYTSDIEEIDVIGELRFPKVGWRPQDQAGSVSLRNTLSMIIPEGSDIGIEEAVYIIWRDIKWTVTSIEYKPPRVELGFGGRYNG